MQMQFISSLKSAFFFLLKLLDLVRLRKVDIQNGKHFMGSRLIMGMISIHSPIILQSYDVLPRAELSAFACSLQ